MRRARQDKLPRRTLANIVAPSVEDMVNLKTLASILHADILKEHEEALQPFTEEELEYLIENRLKEW